MNATRFVAIALILAGSLGLIYGNVSYTKNTEHLKVGPLELAIKEKETVNIPAWAGVAAIVAGAALLLIRK